MSVFSPRGGARWLCLSLRWREVSGQVNISECRCQPDVCRCPGAKNMTRYSPDNPATTQDKPSQSALLSGLKQQITLNFHYHFNVRIHDTFCVSLLINISDVSTWQQNDLFAHKSSIIFKSQNKSPGIRNPACGSVFGAVLCENNILLSKFVLLIHRWALISKTFTADFRKKRFNTSFKHLMVTEMFSLAHRWTEKKLYYFLNEGQLECR